MATLKISSPLRPYVDGKPEVTLSGQTVAEAIQNLTSQYPALKTHLFKSNSELRPFVHVFVNDEDIQHLQGMETPLAETDRLMLIPSIAGGKEAEGDAA
ncbi:MAG: MoaD/ThiS family protein [Chloroflexi bacterium]|nr:MoaD/ThiS family protein [Chloroflexota bacterium]MCL4561662.1 MoaD/ThiS family protein [Chloroflexota bacterium]